MTLPEVYGFLFAVCACPEPVETAEWMAVVFNGESPAYKNEEKQVKIEQALLEVYAEVEALVQLDMPQLPELIELLEPAMENVGDGAPLAFWADGFFDGIDWLEDVWNANLDEDAEKVWRKAVKTLVYFSHRDEAKKLAASDEDTWISAEQLAENRVLALPEAMAIYARMGKALVKHAEMNQPYIREIKLGRNDPCICGSGKKYKHCCMEAA